MKKIIQLLLTTETGRTYFKKFLVWSLRQTQNELVKQNEKLEKLRKEQDELNELIIILN